MTYRTTPITVDVTVDIYPGVSLDGDLMCSIEQSQDGPVIDNQEVRVRDRNGAMVAVDWDDLSDSAQRSIDRQVLAYFDIDVAA